MAVASFAELGPTLVISAFTGNPLAADGLSVIPHLDKTIRNFAGAVSVALPNPTWPNTITPFPKGTFAPNQEGFLLGGGFLVPPKCLGSMNVVSLNETAPSESTLTKISADKGGVLSGGWFYHEGQLLDMDGDGRLDVLAARAIKPIFGAWTKRESDRGGRRTRGERNRRAEGGGTWTRGKARDGGSSAGFKSKTPVFPHHRPALACSSLVFV